MSKRWFNLINNTFNFTLIQAFKNIFKKVGLKKKLFDEEV